MTHRTDGRWQRSVTINGKRLYFYSNEKTERMAERDIIRQICEYEDRNGKNVPFSILADEWEESHGEDISFNTRQKYGRAKRKAVDYFGNAAAESITVDDVEAYLDAFAEKKYARDSVSCYLSVLSQIIQYGMRYYHIMSNPCNRARMPKNLSKESRKPPEADEIAVILRSADAPFGLFPLMAVLTGLRREELLALTYGDIDIEAKVIHVTKAITFQHNKGVVSPTKTSASVRDVILPDSLVPLLQGKGKADEYVFPGADPYSPMTEQMYRRAYERYKKATGVKATAHCLRHGYATLLYDANVDAKLAQSQLGHSKLSTTMDIYTHISESRREEGRDKFNNFLAGL